MRTRADFLIRLERLLAWATARPRRRVLGPVLLLACIALGIGMVERVRAQSSDYPMTVAYGNRLLFEGENVYETESAGGTHTKYPPFFFLLTAAFAALPLTLGAALWYVLHLVLAIVCGWCAVRAVQPVGAPAPSVTQLLGPLALSLPFLVPNLLIGQSNILVLTLVTVGLLLASRGRRLAAGGALAGAAALKLTPALLLAVLGWKRAWRLLLGAAFGLALCWLVIPAAVLGPERASDVTRSWSRVVLGFVEAGAAAETTGDEAIGYRQTNQSLDAAVHRLLCDVPAVLPTAHRPGLRVNVARLPVDDPLVTGIVRGLALLVLLTLLWLTRGALARGDPMAVCLDASLALLAMLLIAPISWDTHYVALLVPYAAALEAMRRRPPGHPLRRRIGRVLSTCLVLTLLGTCPYVRAFSIHLVVLALLGFALASARAAERTTASVVDREQGGQRKAPEQHGG